MSDTRYWLTDDYIRWMRRREHERHGMTLAEFARDPQIQQALAIREARCKERQTGKGRPTYDVHKRASRPGRGEP